MSQGKSRGKQVPMSLEEAKRLVMSLCQPGITYADLSELLDAAKERSTSKRLTRAIAMRAIGVLQNAGKLSAEGPIRRIR